MEATVSDTIVALSTPSGRSGIGLIRISGTGALHVLRSLLKDRAYEPESHRARLKSILDPDTGAAIERAIVTYFKAPHSFTGEDIVELGCHGSPVLLRQIINATLRLNARAADPGEFTLRALRNGKLNLSQAEAIRDLIDAQTSAGVRQAVRQLGGELSLRLTPIKEDLLRIIVVLESAIEFVEEDLPEFQTTELLGAMEKVQTELQALSSTFKVGRLLREGLKVTLGGKPNVGKSSIFNRLLATDRAIVTELPGTTRDTLSELINLDGVPVLLTDTAGLRDSGDKIEILGVERSRRALSEADLILVVLDGSEPLTSEDRDALSELPAVPRLVALNKSDLDGFDMSRASSIEDVAAVIPISATNGTGLEALRAGILSQFNASDIGVTEFMITDVRHFDLLNRAATAIGTSSHLMRRRAGEELVLVGLHDALRFLGDITGETTPDEILGRIFATFCIGK